MYEPLAEAYWPARVPLWSSCNVPVLETTPPQMMPVPGSRTPAYESKLSLTLSRTARNVKGPPSGRKRIPPVKFSTGNTWGETPKSKLKVAVDICLSPATTAVDRLPHVSQCGKLLN